MDPSRWNARTSLAPIILLLSALLTSACSGGPATGPLPTTPTLFAPAGPTLSIEPTGTDLPPTATATPDLYAGLTVSDLAARDYGGAPLVFDRWTQPAFQFERGFFHYNSDGLTVHGFMNVPNGEGPFPVILVLHGYVDPDGYDTLTYTTPYADELARAGYFVIHPNYRNYPPSDPGGNRFRVGYTVDVLNLLAVLREGAGRPGPLQKAGADSIGLFGHSMGGGIALRAITVDPEIDAALLYGSMSGDEEQNYAKILEWSEGLEGWEELNTSQEVLARISPIEHLERIEAAVSIHHGEADVVVPPSWSTDLCMLLQEAEKSVECFAYPGMPHNFYGDGYALLMERAERFFRRMLSD